MQRIGKKEQERRQEMTEQRMIGGRVMEIKYIARGRISQRTDPFVKPVAIPLLEPLEMKGQIRALS